MGNVKEEGEILKRFIETRLKNIKYETEVLVGRGYLHSGALKFISKYPNVYKAIAKRIDLVVYEGPYTWIYEAKQRASIIALGQLLTYKFLYCTEKKVSVDDIKLGLICKYEDKILEPVLGFYGIRLFVMD